MYITDWYRHDILSLVTRGTWLKMVWKIFKTIFLNNLNNLT